MKINLWSFKFSDYEKVQKFSINPRMALGKLNFYTRT